MAENKVVRSVSINKKTWAYAQARALASGVSLSLVIAKLLQMWVAGDVVITLEAVKPVRGVNTPNAGENA